MGIVASALSSVAQVNRVVARSSNPFTQIPRVTSSKSKDGPGDSPNRQPVVPPGNKGPSPPSDNQTPTNKNAPPPQPPTTHDQPTPPSPTIPAPPSTQSPSETDGPSTTPTVPVNPTSTLVSVTGATPPPATELSVATPSGVTDENGSTQTHLLNEPESSPGPTISNGAGDPAPLSPIPIVTTITFSDGVATTETEYSTPSGANPTLTPSIQSASSGSHVNTTAIVAGVLVPLLLLLFVGAGYLFYRRRRRLRDRREWERTHEEIAEAVRQVGPGPPIGAWARLDNASQGDLELHGERTPNHGDTYPFQLCG